MLKPKKEIFRKEIKRDPFLESMDKAEAHFEDHRSNYLKVVIGIAVFALLLKLYFNKQNNIEISSNTDLGQALVALNKGDIQNATFQFESLMNEYDGFEAAEVAAYYMGKIAFELKDNQKAQDYLKTYIDTNPLDILIPPSKLMLAHIELENDNYQSALMLIDQGIKFCNDKHRKRMLNLEKAKINLEYGKISEAKSIVDNIHAQNDLNSIEKQLTEELLGAISG
ncbi:MAG: hypothetical protein CMG74_07910 [Candidatus Marinimicrobia bacterium]|nr:hypothetical protein [Candidatus Neomarinimicrobiota bacterium]|tara:strand:- start:677 stop:1351 length:675 start_codon:yes stop_codon:yes gene_type:complete